jgi:hypothetical protein
MQANDISKEEAFTCNQSGRRGMNSETRQRNKRRRLVLVEQELLVEGRYWFGCCG